MNTEKDVKRRYMPGLDGLRALAVLAVIAYHFNWDWASGGLVGVGVFFVLSGYLITDLLLHEHQQYGRIDWKQFWIRRARRLLPAMLLMLLLVVVVLVLFDTGRMVSIRGEILAALAYVSNWHLIFHQVSYFESFGPPSPIGHLWSLAVEEQFYLVWPLLLIGMIRLIRPTRGKLALLTLAVAAVSFAAMALIYESGSDPSRVYYGTDTRAFGLLIGAALAIIWPSSRLTTMLSKQSSIKLDMVGVCGLMVIFYMIFKTDDYDESLYRGGMVVLSVASALIIAAVASPYSAVGKLLSWKPLQWIGLRSYGLYLWHYPVIILSNPANPNAQPGFMLQLVQLALSIGLAALSYKYLEVPIRNGNWKTWRTQMRQRLTIKMFTASHKLPKLFLIGMIIMLCTSCSQNESGDADASSLKVKEGTAEQSHAPLDPLIQPEEQATKKLEGSLSPNRTAASKSQSDEKGLTVNSSDGVTVIGDSVIVGVTPYLEKLVPGIVVDGKVSRQMSDAVEVAQKLESRRKLGKTVIIQLGTNGSFSSKTLDLLLDDLGDERQIVLINSRVPRKWQKNVNKTLDEAAKDRSNVKLIDWHSVSADKPEWFTKDGVHLTPEGAEVLASLINEAIQSK